MAAWEDRPIMRPEYPEAFRPAPMDPPSNPTPWMAMVVGENGISFFSVQQIGHFAFFGERNNTVPIKPDHTIRVDEIADPIVDPGLRGGHLFTYPCNNGFFNIFSCEERQ